MRAKGHTEVTKNTLCPTPVNPPTPTPQRSPENHSLQIRQTPLQMHEKMHQHLQEIQLPTCQNCEILPLLFWSLHSSSHNSNVDSQTWQMSAKVTSPDFSSSVPSCFCSQKSLQHPFTIWLEIHRDSCDVASASVQMCAKFKKSQSGLSLPPSAEEKIL